MALSLIQKICRELGLVQDREKGIPCLGATGQYHFAGLGIFADEHFVGVEPKSRGKADRLTTTIHEEFGDLTHDHAPIQGYTKVYLSK